MSTTSFRYLDHMTDVIVEAFGNTLEDAFANSARGLVNAMFELSEVIPNMEIKIYADGYDLESLLYNWLEKIILVMLIDNIVISNLKVNISERNGNYSIIGVANGEHIDLEKHHYKIEIKAVTYHEMAIKQDCTGVTIRFLLDL
ncbi:MAG TPA: archease [Candidatus Bathyarchaeia archaeon]|nr:archease [Candidatus Bathyarchaeia archaeon]